MSIIFNDRLIKALKGENVDRPPVWIMRQAGRYLPEFLELRDKYDFLTRCKTPDLSAEITLQPIRRFNLDAAIIFSDILIVPDAMGLKFNFIEGKGPILDRKLLNIDMINDINEITDNSIFSYLYNSIKIVNTELNNKIPLIGFAGSPWTLFCYCIEGRTSKNFNKTRELIYKFPNESHLLLSKITKTIITLLSGFIDNGINVIQIFDSWGGLLSYKDYNNFSLKYINKIVNFLSNRLPVIIYAKGCWHSLANIAKLNISALSIDSYVPISQLDNIIKNKKITIQGNYDPYRLLFLNSNQVYNEVTDMINNFGVNRYIVNLGHGILPSTPLKNVYSFIDSVLNYKLVF